MRADPSSLDIVGPIEPSRLVALAAVLAAATVVVAAGCGVLDAGIGADETADTARSSTTVPHGDAARVVRVIDGDSLELEIEGREVEVRLENYNAPELFDDENRRSCNGEASRDALAERVVGRAVEVVGDDVDRFGRRLADLLVDGRSVTAELIAYGHGLALWPEGGRRAAMKEAAAAGLGLWGDRCGRPVTDGLRIGRAQPNPPGPDAENLADEWVELVNDSDRLVDLEGWVIRDHTTSNRFPLTGRLRPGDRLTVRSGSGRSTERDLFLGESFPVWSNEDETVLLIDPAGVVADWAFLD